MFKRVWRVYQELLVWPAGQGTDHLNWLQWGRQVIPTIAVITGVVVSLFTDVVSGVWAGLAVGALGVAFLAGVAMSRLIGRLEKFEARPRPHLVFDPGKVRRVHMGASSRRAYAVNTSVEVWAGGLEGTEREPDSGEIVYPRADVDVGIVTVRNNPTDRDEKATAHKVIVALRFAKDGKDWVSLMGRWSDNEQPSVRGAFAPIDDIRRRDLHPNNEPNIIDIGLRHVGDDMCYAFNDETINSVSDWRDPALALPIGRYQVFVTLQGVGMDDAEEVYIFENWGKGGAIRIERQSDFDMATSPPQPVMQTVARGPSQ